MHNILGSLAHSVGLSTTVVCSCKWMHAGSNLVVWVPTLFRHGTIVVDAQDGATALIMAARNGHTSTVALLMEKGASVDHAIEVK